MNFRDRHLIEESAVLMGSLAYPTFREVLLKNNIQQLSSKKELEDF